MTVRAYRAHPMPDTPQCGLPHYTWPETVCTEPAGHYRPEVDPHAGPLIIDGRQRGGCAWDEPTQPPDPPMPDTPQPVRRCGDVGAHPAHRGSVLFGGPPCPGVPGPFGLPYETAPPEPPMPDDTTDDTHVCKPGASLYYCPTAGEVESDCHGGFDTCCGRTDLHQPLVPCTGVVLKRPHPGHSWEPQPGAPRVRCEGFESPGQPAYDTAIDTAQQAAAHHTDGAIRDRLHAALRAHGEGDTDHGTGSDYGDQAAAVLAELAPELAAAEARASAATRVQREISRLSQLPTVTADDGRADSFATGARWAIRQIHNALTGQEPTL